MPARRSTPADRFGRLWIPRDFASVAAYQAVIPLLAYRGSITSDFRRDDVGRRLVPRLPWRVRMILKVGRMWKFRSRDLAERRWSNAGRLEAIRRCLPFGFARPAEVRVPCTTPGCPYCHMRQVHAAARRVHALFFPAGSRSPVRAAVDLVTVERRYHPELDDPLALTDYYRMRGSRSGPCSRFREVNALNRKFGGDGFGAVEFVHTQDQGLAEVWEIAARQVIMVPRGARLPRGFAVAGPHVTIEAVSAPTRAQLRRAITSAFRYPTLYMTGEASRAVAALEARRGRRLIASAGLLRHRTP